MPTDTRRFSPPEMPLLDGTTQRWLASLGRPTSPGVSSSYYLFLLILNTIKRKLWMSMVSPVPRPMTVIPSPHVSPPRT
jgi:hypothetical protein